MKEIYCHLVGLEEKFSLSSMSLVRLWVISPECPRQQIVWWCNHNFLAGQERTFIFIQSIRLLLILILYVHGSQGCLSCAIFAGVQAHFVQDSGWTRLDQVIFCLMFQMQNVITAKAAAHVHKMLRQSRLKCAARLQAQVFICCKDRTMFMPIPGSSSWHAVDPRWM